jgi:vacuolar protein sorting-associated protein 45
LAVSRAVFTNRIDDLRLQDLAEVDFREAVFQVQEFFGDFSVIDPHHFTVPILQNHVTLQPFTWDYGRRQVPQAVPCILMTTTQASRCTQPGMCLLCSTDAVSRMTEGLASLMLALRRRFVVR